MDWVERFYSTRSRWFGPTGIFAEHRARAADVKRLCGPGAKRILELGAGSGGTAAAMADLGYTVVAVELSSVRAQFARDLAKSRPNLTVLEADFYNVDLQGRFDVVCCWDGFGMGSDDDQCRLLQRVSREWLEQAGTMLLDIFSPLFWSSLAGRQERIETVSRLVDGEVRTVRLDVPVIARQASIVRPAGSSANGGRKVGRKRRSAKVFGVIRPRLSSNCSQARDSSPTSSRLLADPSTRKIAAAMPPRYSRETAAIACG